MNTAGPHTPFIGQTPRAGTELWVQTYGVQPAWISAALVVRVVDGQPSFSEWISNERYNPSEPYRWNVTSVIRDEETNSEWTDEWEDNRSSRAEGEDIDAMREPEASRGEHPGNAGILWPREEPVASDGSQAAWENILLANTGSIRSVAVLMATAGTLMSLGFVALALHLRRLHARQGCEVQRPGDR